MTRRVLVAVGGVMVVVALGRPTAAQSLAQAGGGGAAAAPVETVTLEPIECWWRTDTGAVRVGELFSLVLTCAVVESASTTVVPDQSKLDPGVLQVPPFEVVRGTQARDVRTGTHRFFQYEYALRYVGEDFGKDVSLAPLTMTYRVLSQTPQAVAAEGRERQYILPALTVRILSLVPAGANDIRDQPSETFLGTEARRFRANLFRIAAGFLYVVGIAVALSGIVPVARRRARLKPVAAALASDGAILRRVSQEFDEVRRLRGVEGWTDRLAARALGALRIVVAYALGRQVNQAPGEGANPSEGQLVVPRRWPRRGATLVSSPVTAASLAETGGVAAGNSGDLGAAIARFAREVYGRETGNIQGMDLDEALDIGVGALQRLSHDHGWPAKARRAIASRLGRPKADPAGGVTRPPGSRVRDRS